MNFKRRLGTALILFFVLVFLSCPVLAQDNNAAQKQTESLPASYDLRNVDGKNYVTPVKNQGLFGTCWAHAAMSCAETNIMLKGGSQQDLSEKALAWYTYQLQGALDAPDDELEGVLSTSYQIANRPVGFQEESNIYDNGGKPLAAPCQMSNWLGASTEEQIPYQNTNGDMTEYENEMVPDIIGDWTLDYYDIFENAYHLQNSEIGRGIALDVPVETYTQDMKELILKYGSIALTYSSVDDQEDTQYFNNATWSQYIPAGSNEESYHCVTVVGWDDNYSASNFRITPPGNGAWIIKNSWGSTWGEDGYFYLSYYDSTITVFASYDVETPELGYSYDYNYQYDFIGDKDANSFSIFDANATEIIESGKELSPDSYQFANVFTSNGNENLDAVSVYSINQNSEVTAQVYLLNDDYTSPVDGQLVETATASYDHRGLHTLKLSEPIALKPNQKFSVVESIVYTVTMNNQTMKIPFYSLEYGLENPTLDPMIDQLGQEVGYSVQSIIAHVGEGESYVYGVSDDITDPSNVWSDVSKPETYKMLSQETTIKEAGEEVPNTFVPGNCMIKAYTTESDPGVILPTGVEFEPGPLYLSTDPTGVMTTTASASLVPSDATGEIRYSVYPETVASVTQNGNLATITAISEGEAKLVASSTNGYVATKDIIVSNSQFVVDGVTVNNVSQDYFTIEVDNLYSNPALSETNNAASVSVFVWSADNMSDVQALSATRLTGTDNWITSSFGINKTKSYLLNADNIKYIVYVGDGTNGNNNMVFTGFASWVQPSAEGQGRVSYISYNQNTGFVEPTVHSGTSGLINDPNSVHMEGLRVSSGIPGVNVITSVHAADIGWMDPAGDGVYAGTMHQNRALEAVKMELDTTLNNYRLSYRVYITGQGWTDWVQEGKVAGTTGEATPIQAVDIQITPTSNQ